MGRRPPYLNRKAPCPFAKRLDCRGKFGVLGDRDYLRPEILLRGGAGEGSVFRRRQDTGNDLRVSGFERRNLGVVVARRQIKTAWIYNLVAFLLRQRSEDLREGLTV